MKLSEHTKNTIKKVKTDKREINLEKKGSLIIYSYENIMTNKETKETVNTIMEDIKSTVKLQYKSKIPILIQ